MQFYLALSCVGSQTWQKWQYVLPDCRAIIFENRHLFTCTPDSEVQNKQGSPHNPTKPYDLFEFYPECTASEF